MLHEIYFDSTKSVCYLSCVKGAVSSLFSAKRCIFCLWKPKNNGPVLLKWISSSGETIKKYVWVRMARTEMVPNLKTSGRIFQVSVLVSKMKSLKPKFGLFLFENSSDIVPLVV